MKLCCFERTARAQGKRSKYKHHEKHDVAYSLEKVGWSERIQSEYFEPRDQEIWYESEEVINWERRTISCNEPHSLRVLVTSLEGHLILITRGVFPQIPLVTMLFLMKTLELDIRDQRGFIWMICYLNNTLIRLSITSFLTAIICLVSGVLLTRMRSILFNPCEFHIMAPSVQ